MESCRSASGDAPKNKALAIGLGIGLGVGVPVIIIIAIIVILVLKRQSSKADSGTELTGKKTSTQQANTKVAPSGDFEDGKHTPLGSYKANDPSLTSANLLTNPDVTADDQTAKNGKGAPAKFNSKPGNNQSK